MFFPRSLLPLGCVLLTAAPVLLHAQRPPIPGDLPAPPAAAPAAAVPPALPGTPTRSGPAEETVRLQTNGQVADILEMYGELTGKRILTDNTVQGSVSLNITTPVPRSEAISIIETTLTLNGFALVPGDGNIVKVLGLNKNPRVVGVPIFSDLSQLPVSEQFVSFLLRLRYLDPQETTAVLQAYIPVQGGQTAAFTPLEKAGAIIITDDANSVRRLVELVTSLDQPLAPLTEKFVRLERADAAKAIEFLNAVFESKSASTPGQPAAAAPGVNNPGVRRPIRRVDETGQVPPDPAALPGAIVSNGGQLTLSGDSIIQGRITLTADVRTNRVHIVTNPVNMPLVEKLLEEYDTDTPFATPIPRPLKFISAGDVLPILVQALSEPGSDNPGGTNGTAGNSGTTPRPSGLNSPTSSSSGLNSSSSSTGSSASGGSSDIGNGELNTQSVDTKPAIAVVGSTKIIADSRVNTIIVLGNREANDKVAAILDKLDVRAPQVVIRTLIGELSLGNNYELGFNYLLRTNRGSIISQSNPGFLTSATPSASPATGATSTDTLNNLTTLATGLASGFSGVGGILTIGKSFDIILSALESTNRFKTISRPMIFTSNNKEAIIASGQEIAVPSSSVGTTNGTVGGSVGTYTNVEFKNVVLQLEVVPLINSEKEVTLDIVQKIDSVVSGSNTVVNGTAVPTIATRKLKSTVSAPNNSTIVLGGLITQNESKADSNIPYLSRIPVIGNLFRSRTRDAGRSELIILLHPEVVNTPALLASMRANEEHRTYLGGGLEEQLLPNEVRKATPVTTTPVTTAPADGKDTVRRTRSTPAPTTPRKTVRQPTTRAATKKPVLVDPY